MRHLESAFAGKNSFWRYIVMFGAVFLATNTVGAIPLLIGLFMKAATSPESVAGLAADPNNLSALGFDPNLTLFMMLFPSVAGIIVFILFIRPLNQRSFLQTVTGSPSIRWSRMLVSGFVWIVFSLLYLFVYKGLDPGNFLVNNTSVTLVYLAAISLLLIPVQAALEEVLFRGYLLQGFAVLLKNRWLPVLITSVLFGLMHSWNPEVEEYGFFKMFPQYVLSGLLFGIITVVDDGTEIAIGAHAANNVFLSIMVTHSSSILQTPSVFEQVKIEPWVEFWALVVTSILFFMLMKMIYRWKTVTQLWKRINPEGKFAQVL